MNERSLIIVSFFPRFLSDIFMIGVFVDDIVMADIFMAPVVMDNLVVIAGLVVNLFVNLVVNLVVIVMFFMVVSRAAPRPLAATGTGEQPRHRIYSATLDSSKAPVRRVIGRYGRADDEQRSLAFALMNGMGCRRAGSPKARPRREQKSMVSEYLGLMQARPSRSRMYSTWRPAAAEIDRATSARGGARGDQRDAPVKTQLRNAEALAKHYVCILAVLGPPGLG